MKLNVNEYVLDFKATNFNPTKVSDSTVYSCIYI